MEAQVAMGLTLSLIPPVRLGLSNACLPPPKKTQAV